MLGIPENQRLEYVPNVTALIGIKRGPYKRRKEIIPTRKQCTKCGIIKSVIEFYESKDRTIKYRSHCKACIREEQELYYKANIEKIRKRASIYRTKNRIKVNARSARWRKENLEKYYEVKRIWRKANPKKNCEMAKRWREKNIEKVRTIQREQNKRVRATPKGALNHAMSTKICKVLNGNKRNRNWESLVGYSVDQLKKHLERHFLPGMSWKNRSEWHIDHIIPLAVFNYEKPENIDFHRAWALKNLQPLWKIENISKSDNFKEPFQPSLSLG